MVNLYQELYSATKIAYANETGAFCQALTNKTWNGLKDQYGKTKTVFEEKVNSEIKSLKELATIIRIRSGKHDSSTASELRPATPRILNM